MKGKVISPLKIKRGFTYFLKRLTAKEKKRDNERGFCHIPTKNLAY